MANNSRTSLLVAATLLGAAALTPTGSQAQLSAGGGIAGAMYDIVSADGQLKHLGVILVLPENILSLPESHLIIPDMIMIPKDFDDGVEYWYWDNATEAYPDSFILVPTQQTALPSTKASDYDTFDHLLFDLSDPHPFPKVYTDNDDLTFAVQSVDAVAWPYVLSPDDKEEGWFTFKDGGLGDQLAFADKEIDVPVFDIDEKNEGLLFTRSYLPAPGSVEIVEPK